MWHELTLKEIEAKVTCTTLTWFNRVISNKLQKNREMREMLDRRHREKETQQVWDKQIKGKQLLKEEMSRVAQEDKLEMEKLGEQLRREEIAGLFTVKFSSVKSDSLIFLFVALIPIRWSGSPYRSDR